MPKPITCKSCTAQIATENNGTMAIKAAGVSLVEISVIATEIKCRPCGNWNTFTDGVQSLNSKKRSEEVLNHRPSK